MADQPTITNSDTSDLLTFNGIFRPRILTLAASDVLAKYTVLGIRTSDGEFTLCKSTATDGSQMPKAILMEEVTNGVASEASVTVQVMLSGEFDGSHLVFDNGTDTLSTLVTPSATDADSIKIEDALAQVGLINTFRSVEDELDNQ